MNRHMRPARKAEEAAVIIRAAMDALTTGQADRSDGAVASLDRALWDWLESTPAQELDRI